MNFLKILNVFLKFFIFNLLLFFFLFNYSFQFGYIATFKYLNDFFDSQNDKQLDNINNEIYNKYLNNPIYSSLILGKQSIISFYSFKSSNLFITNKECNNIKNSFYDIKESSESKIHFENIHSNILNINGTLFSDYLEGFYILQNEPYKYQYKNKDICSQTFINIFYQIEDEDIDEDINCLIIGLKYPNRFKNEEKRMNFPFITQINKFGITNNLWNIKFFNKNKLDYRGIIIFGYYPYEYDTNLNKNLYKTIKLSKNPKYLNNDYIEQSKTNKYIDYGYLPEYQSIDFEEIYFDDINYNKYKLINNTGLFDFNLRSIIAPELFKEYIIEIYFKKYISKNICKFINIDKNKYKCIICEKNEIINELKLLTEIKFKINLGNETFSFKFNNKDLFDISNNNKYFIFMIMFENIEEIKNDINNDNIFISKYNIKHNITYWKIGRIFIEKYNLVFDHESRKIGFYVNNNSEIIINKKNEKYNEEIDEKKK